MQTFTTVSLSRHHREKGIHEDDKTKKEYIMAYYGSAAVNVSIAVKKKINVAPAIMLPIRRRNMTLFLIVVG
ncbi:MAG: hypothetical protein IIV45_12205 [Lachnospiraceae bacterium]|nr:hypothetical protein [Lachnospiraceae bacterium]